MSNLLTLHDPVAAREHYLSGVWQTETLYSLARRHSIERGSAYAVRDSERRITWSALVAWVDAVAGNLHDAGVRRGDRVSIWLSNRLETVVILLACSRNGYVCNPSLHQNYTVAEVETLLARIKCRAFFVQPGWGADAAANDIFASVTKMTHIKRVYALPSLRGESFEMPERAHRMPMPLQEPKIPVPPASTRPDQIAYLAFTSGTTGTPKGVMHSDNTLLANARAMVTDWGQNENTVLLSLSPLSHHIATVALTQVLVAGCELVIYDPTFGVAPFDWIETTGATYVMGVPTHAIDLLHDVERRGATQLGALKVFYMAGAPIPTGTARHLLELGVTPQNVYGMTECGSHQYTVPTDRMEVITSTCGKSCAGYEIKLWQPDNPDAEAAPGEIGEIGGRGGLLMLGYFDNQSATESSFNSSGWFMSGDLGRFDAAGNLEIVGRKKDMIIRGGHNIYPAHIEEYAIRHPAVVAAAAFGVLDDRLGEKVCLAVVCDGKELIAQELLAHLATQGLSRFDMPEYFLSLPSFPLTASGKILKRELAEWVKVGHVQPQPVRYRALQS
jgi:acyl-CoA synthetase